MKLLLGDTSAARKHAEAAIALNGGLVSSLPLVIAYKTLFDITEQEGDTKAALELYKKYASAERGYREDVAAREMAYQVVRAQSLQQGKEIELLNKKNEVLRSEEHTSELQSLMRRSDAVLCLKKKKNKITHIY